MTEEAALRRLGRYEIVGELGRGAMGKVYAAFDPAIGRKLAIKTIRLDGKSDESEYYSERFVREARAAGNLSHPNIVTIHDFGEDQASGISFIAMELIEGPSLKTLLQRRKVYSLVDVCEIGSQLADALDYAHREGIIHRDIKPANILIANDGVVKIADFGIAKLSNSSNFTTAGTLLGTPKYMSPEQVTGASVDGRSDLFSLGMVLYELLTLEPPFSGETMITMSYKIVHERFVLPSQKRIGLPQEFDRLITKALTKEPWNRYQHGQELAADLRELGARLQAGEVAFPVPMEAISAGDTSGRHAAFSETLPIKSVGSFGGISAAPDVSVAESVSRPAILPSNRAAGSTRLALIVAAVAVHLVLVSEITLFSQRSLRRALIPVARRSAVTPRTVTDNKLVAEAERLTAERVPAEAAQSISEEATPASEGKYAMLTVNFESSLPKGTLKVRAGQRNLLTVLFSGPRPHIRRTVKVPPIHESLQIELTTPNRSFLAPQPVDCDFVPGKTSTLLLSVFQDRIVATLR